MRATLYVGVFLAIIVILPGLVIAQETSSRTFGVGVQAAPFPVFGPAITYNPNNNFGLQVMGRVGIDVDFAAIRALARLKYERNYNVYFSALLGVFRDNDVTEFIFDPEQTDTAVGYGIGAGFEYFFSAIPAIGWSMELDYIHIGFEEKWFEYEYKTFQLIMLGLGVNYYF